MFVGIIHIATSLLLLDSKYNSQVQDNPQTGYFDAGKQVLLLRTNNSSTTRCEQAILQLFNSKHAQVTNMLPYDHSNIRRIAESQYNSGAQTRRGCKADKSYVETHHTAPRTKIHASTTSNYLPTLYFRADVLMTILTVSVLASLAVVVV
jgi:hypothetical protein